jgi:hypothetical protein
VRSSLSLLLFFIVSLLIVFIIVVVFIAVPCPRFFHNRRRKGPDNPNM